MWRVAADCKVGYAAATEKLADALKKNKTLTSLNLSSIDTSHTWGERSSLT